MRSSILAANRSGRLLLACLCLASALQQSGATNNPDQHRQQNGTQANSPAVQLPTSSSSQATPPNQTTPINSNQAVAANPCHRACSNAEFAHILERISSNSDILRDFQRNESSNKTTTSAVSSGQIRAECIKQLIQIIRKLASSEIEMKTLLEFASSANQVNLRSDLSYLRRTYSSEPTLSDQQDQAGGGGRQCPAGGSGEIDPNSSETRAKSGQLEGAPEYLLGDEPNPLAADSDPRAQLVPKLVASVEQWLDNIERFTLTREWDSLMRVSSGIESILGMFPSLPTGAGHKQASSGGGKTIGPKAMALNSTTDKLVAGLERELPGQVQTLTSSLNQLFPWHVWPWNNVDLYATVDTFMNHGIFAFSKTTAGPERRIDYLPQMLDSLFKVLKWDSFPKKCLDWSKMICNLDSFYMGLVEASQLDSSETFSSNSSEMKRRANKLTIVPENKLTQELVCIMFSSLSMQQFGGKDNLDLCSFEADSQQLPSSSSSSSNPSSSQLRWDKQIRKALKLYRLSREALSDEQWLALQKQLNDLWSQMKISDRVIMVGRIIQLLTNCHMPREILESALWKDIYKYKNALNQIGDIVIEELNKSSETGQFTIGQLAIGSKHLEEILIRLVKLLPRLLEAISRTTTSELPELVTKFFNEKSAYFKGPCKGHSLAELVPSLSSLHREIGELEKLICEQLDTKPSITMAQINNLTNEFLAMALNFTNLPNLPRLWQSQSPAAAATPAAPSAGQQGQALAPSSSNIAEANPQNQTSSIVDELAANPRLAQIVAILQSSALDPPEVHAELPELDWVEAGTSVALFYESIQKLMSFEGSFVVFPEVVSFQEEMQIKLESCKQMFTQFSKRQPVHLAAYTLDTVMPIALRTFRPLESFNAECLSTFRDILGETNFANQQQQQQQQTSQQSNQRESRQWQCAVSATNFASHALDNLIRAFNSMLKNILSQMSRQRDLFKFNKQQTNRSLEVSTTSTTSNLTVCVLFDGSISTLMDNLPQLVDLALETILIASTSANQRLTLKETLCSFENTLDPLGDGQQVQKQHRLREAICHLLHESSLTACAEVLRADQWSSTMRHLNVTWFEVSAVSVAPSFRGILEGVDEFVGLFSKVKPSSMSDGLLARVLNFDSYWMSLVNKLMSSFEKYKERRFQVALQILVPIIYENLPLFQQQQQLQLEQQPTTLNETRHALKLSIYGAKSLQNYLQQANNSNSNTSSDQSTLLLQRDIASLFEWADRHLLGLGETLLRTVANNLTKLERLVDDSRGPLDVASARVCATPIDTYLEFEPATGPSGEPNKASLTHSQARQLEMSQAREFLCQFDWHAMETRLLRSNQALNSSSSSNNNNNNNNNNIPFTILDQHSTRQLVRVALTKWGQVLDLVVSEGESSTGAVANATRLPKFLSLSHWQPLHEKLPSIAPSRHDPTNFIWVWQALEQLLNLADANGAHALNLTATNQTSGALMRIFDQLNCALDTVKGGLTWDNMANIYQDRQDVLAAHSTLNNGIALASAGANTFLAHKKFQRFLNNFVRPRLGLAAFCEMRDKSRLESIFSLASSNGFEQELDMEELVGALESFQEFVCDTNLETLVQNINPISVCYGQSSLSIATNSTNSTTTNSSTSNSNEETHLAHPFPLAATLDRFFKLASLAVLDAKLVDAASSKPPVLDKTQWDQLRRWWLNQTEAHQGNSGLALTLVRVFQTLDSLNAEHVVWRAIFRSFHELAEVSAYLLRAAEIEVQASAEQREHGRPSKLELIREAADSVIKSQQVSDAIGSQLKPANRNWHQQQQLASTLANVMFPELSNFISLRTFKQLRYIKSISDYFVSAPEAWALICRNRTQWNGSAAAELFPWSNSQTLPSGSKFELIGYKLNSSARLHALLCHYHPSQWLTTLNIVLSSRSSSLSKKVNYMTKYLALFTKNYEHNEHLKSYVHSQQMENIEAIANKTVSYLVALSQPFRTLTIGKISNISWHSIPNLLESIDRHLCASKYEQQQQQQQQQNSSQQAYQLALYEPKKPDLEVVICKLPTWNISQVYNYFSENIDLQNMISLATQNNHTAKLFGIVPAQLNTTQTGASSSAHWPVCITPFKFAAKWLKITQDLIDELMSRATKEKIRKCLSLNRKSNSAYVQATRYVKVLNSLLATLNDLTRNNSWPMIRRTWNSISYALLNQSGSMPAVVIPRLAPSSSEHSP